MPQLLQASKLVPQGRGLAPALLRRAPSLELDWDLRQKSRFDAIACNGQHVAVFLPRGTLLRGGDVLVTQEGGLLCVRAAPQHVLRITACAQQGSIFDLMRAAYHLGNRHVPIELKPDHLQIEPDHVLADMLRAMHLTVEDMHAAFEPEGGAYSATHPVHTTRTGHGAHEAHVHEHLHGEGQRHAQRHLTDHAHA